MSLCPFGRFLLRDWRNYESWVHFSQKVSQPNKVTITTPNNPSYIGCSDFELEKGNSPNPEKSSSVFSLRAE